MDKVDYWDGNLDLGIIGTNARNRPPKDIEPFYLHKEKTNENMKHTKDTRLFEPIIAVKNDSRGFQGVHVSFQSSSSCNIESVNFFNECTKVFEVCEKGRGKHKLQWVIGMNHSRRTYC